MRKHQHTIVRAMALLLLLSGSMSVWAATALTSKIMLTQQHCVEQTTHNMVEHQASMNSQHDCCKSTQTCNNLCCNFCTLGSVAGIALLPFINIQFDYQLATFHLDYISLPDGVLTSTPYRPPQVLS